MKTRPVRWWLMGALAFVAVMIAFPLRRPLLDSSVGMHLRGKATVNDRVAQYRDTAGVRLSGYFKNAGLAYPPARVVLLGIKNEKRLEVYAPNAGGLLKLVQSYPILAASGALGPKLEEGDSQVPEGIYRVEALNPNSAFHLGLRLNYPNSFDCEKARIDGRTNLGTDIMIHGDRASIGCLAMGDPAAEELFLLAADTGPENITVLLTPVDFRKVSNVPKEETAKKIPAWTPALYDELKVQVRKLPRS